MSTVVAASSSEKLRSVLNNGRIICGSTPLAMVIRGKMGVEPFQSFRGTDLFRSVLSKSSDFHRHFFLGGSLQTLSALVERISGEFPNVRVVGNFSPEYSEDYKKFLDNSIDQIKNSGANIFWVGLGSPKQDYVVHEIASVLAVKAIAVGVAFDFIAGMVPEAPKWVRGSGFEWVYRLIREPKRLWKRYLIGNIQFLFLAMKDKLQTKR